MEKLSVLEANDLWYSIFSAEHIDDNMKAEKFVCEYIETMIATILNELDIPAHILGHRYLIYAIKKVVIDKEQVTGITKCLYPEIAKFFDTTASRVERSIRHSIYVAGMNGKTKAMEYIFGYVAVKGRKKPTNSEFIERIADEVRLHMKWIFK